jgi:ADP-heptose:LPS heptosyltransferase
VVGGKAEAPLARTVLAAAPGAIDLTGRTSFAELGAVARRAAYAVGNDTGPTHLVATSGCPTLALFGGESDPALCAPRGLRVGVLRHDPLAALGVEEVRMALAGVLGE